MSIESQSPSEVRRWTDVPLHVTLLWRRKRELLLALLVALGLGVGYLLVTPSIYESQARVLVQRRELSVDRERTLRQDRQFVATQAEVVRSPLVVGQALQGVQVDIPRGVKKDKVAYVLSALSVVPVVETDVLKLRYRGSSSQEVVDVISAIMERYEVYLQEIEQDDSTETIELLAQREEDLRGELQTLQQAYLKQRENSPLLGRGREAVAVDMTLLSQISQKLAETQNRRLELQNKLHALSLLTSDDSFTEDRGYLRAPGTKTANSAEPKSEQSSRHLLYDEQTPGSAGLNEIRTALWQAEARQRELATSYGPKHSDMVAISHQIGHWQELVDERSSEIDHLLQQEYALTQQTEETLQRQYDQERESLKKMDNDLLDEEFLLSNIARVESVHASTLAHLQDSQLQNEALQKGQATVTVEVLENATVPKKVWPLTIPFLVVCAAAGLVLGGLLIAGLEHLDLTRSPAALPRTESVSEA